MKILLLTHSYPDKSNSWRGSFIKEQAEALSLIHFVSVVYFKIDYDHFAPFAPYSFIKIQTGNLAEYTITVKRSLPVLNQVNYLFKTYKFIENEILRNEKPDLINSHLSYPAGFLGTIIQKRKRIPNFITEHSRITSYFRSWLHEKCVIYSLKNATCIVPVSNSLKAEIIKISDRPINVIHNIVDTGKFHLANSSPGTILNIGFLGGLGTENKGLDLLLKAASLLRNKTFVLHIGGTGALLDTYKTMSKDLSINILCNFYGEIPGNEVPDFYSRLDLLILPSRYETFGVVLIEAMACGLPVIATKCGGPQEIVTPETGLLIEKNNPELLAEAIRIMSDNLNNYNKDAIRQYAEINFGKSHFIEKITRLYQDLLNKN
jgi:glycosyltransferase involved in cell wall biosynthesis